MKIVNVYTDGSCNVAKKLGGWGVYFEYTKPNGEVVTSELSGNKEGTTNNLMELTAVVKALKACKIDKEDFEFNINMDSKYVMLSLYNRDEYETKNFKKVANAEPLKWFYNFLDSLGITLESCTQSKSELTLIKGTLPNGNIVNFIKVEGHSTCEGNNKADQLAVKARKLLG